MKITKAKIRNFRLLKDLILDFSKDLRRPLTVIRAANETGKTTCEHALMWGLYGSKEALPNKGVYSLFPIDMHLDHKRIEVSVEIEFEADEISSMGRGDQQVKRSSYRLKRSCMEVSLNQQNSSRQQEVVEVHRLTPAGTVLLDDVEAKKVIENALPRDLKDVYFTDGDAAMSFIEAAAAQGVKRKRVSDAIESLLGLDNLAQIQNHLKSVAKKLSERIDATDYGERRNQLEDQIGGHEEDIEEYEEDIKVLNEQIKDGEEREKEIRRKIEELLITGDRQVLVEQRNKKEEDLDKFKRNADARLQDLSKMLTSEKASGIFIERSFTKGYEILSNMSKKKILPRVNVPLLEELLDKKSCYCGADLEGTSDESKSRRESIKQEIENSRKSDAVTEVASVLWFQIRSAQIKEMGGRWKESYASTQGQFADLRKLESLAEQELENINHNIANVKDENLNDYRELESEIKLKLDSHRSEQSKRMAWISELKDRLSDAITERDQIENRLDKKDSGTQQLVLARKMQKLFENIVDKLKKEEVKNVSHHMNRIFLNMIGSDPDANESTLITKAELTEDYDIRVFGPNNVEMNPDQDLNGASRRAITLAFILALTKVSQVEAPNIIDTPLGMTSGYVKQSILKEILKEGSQVVLFLTHAEIQGVEDIIDKYAGKVYTLTNPAHFPKMLLNEPKDNAFSVVRCDCDHKSTCSVCERIEMGSV